MKRNIQRTMLRAARRQNAEASVDLSRVRAWHANTIAMGFTSLQDVMNQRVADVGAQTVSEAVEASIAEYRREGDAMLALLAERTTEYQRRILLPAGGTLQPIDEWGNPDPVVPTGDYTVAFPIQGGGTAWGDNRVSRAMMTVAEANRYTLMVESQDRDWLARHMLAALFTNVVWTFADKLRGNLSIQPLAIASDGVTYVRKGGSQSTDTHYLAQLAAISNAANPFPIIEAELSEHPSNMGDIVVFVPTNLLATIKALGTFRPANDPRLAVGSGVTQYVGPSILGFGDKFIGYEDSGVLLVEWKRLPDNYMVAISTGGPTLLGMREYPAPELQGLFAEYHSPDGNRELNKFIRFAGFGVQNRVGAVVYRIGSADYAIPAGFTAPLPV